MPTLNLGILAHVDAGKTTLTERLLFEAGEIDAVGSVDRGTTQTDSMALERQRGITIRAAVVAFRIDDLVVDIIDTPGHPDFIAEVERSLRVLDAAVLVISAVEGVQAQSIVLMRALQRLAVPTLLFVNKVDRAGADPDRVLAGIAERLTPCAVPLGSVQAAGTAAAEYRPDGMVRPSLAVDTAALAAHPLVLGSAITGAGVPELTAAMARLLPRARCDADGAPSGLVFKVDRRPNGEKVAHVRMYSGTIRVRQRIRYGTGTKGTITGLGVFGGGGGGGGGAVGAGQIAALTGLREVRVGDWIGTSADGAAGEVFARPSLETAIVPTDPTQKGGLHAALAALAEQDPLIDLRQDDVRQELFLSLYGEVQKEVIQQRLMAEAGIAVEFRPTTTICIERVTGAGSAVMRMRRGNPFLATVGLRVEPAHPGTGVRLALDVELSAIPLYVYKSIPAFREAMEEYVRSTLTQGLQGWEVPDATVTLTDCDYIPPGTKAQDYRKLTPLVVMAALREAGTVVCEPIHRFRLEAPADSLPAILALLPRLRAVPHAPALTASWLTLEGDIPAVEYHRVQEQLRGLTRGEGVVESRPHSHAPVVGPAPSRPRTDDNPLDRREYLHRVRR